MPPRVISLLPSATEIVCALGCAEWLVGRSHECDFPAEIQSLPACSTSRLSMQADSRAIDLEVKTLLSNGLSLYDVDSERLRELQPDVILTQTQCAVCAVSPADIERAVCQWTGRQPLVVSLEPHDLAGVWESLDQVAVALGVPQRGEALIEQLQQRLARLSFQTSQSHARPTVVCLEWLDPLMAAGNWSPELIELAGGIPLFGTPGEHSPWLSWEELQYANPEVLVAVPCGWNLARCRSELEPLTRHPAWDRLLAVQRQSVFVVDGNQYFNRPGPRLVETVEILAEILHPELFSPARSPTGWQRLTAATP